MNIRVNACRFTLSTIAIICITAGWVYADGADTLITAINKSSFKRGDTISWECVLPAVDKSNNAATIQLWIENTRTKQLWKYRYPMLNGAAGGDLVISDDLPEGIYALNFLLEKRFFSLEGRVRDSRKQDTALRYMLIARDKEMIMQYTRLEKNGRFAIGKYLFQDTALFIFSPAKATESNDLWINLSTPLDSAFVPAVVSTRFVSVDVPPSQGANSGIQDYHFDAAAVAAPGARELEGVTVTARSGKQLDAFVRDNVSARFIGTNDLTFNGLDNPEISRSVDLYTFLMAHAPGLTLQLDGETGDQELLYRNSRVTIYINEFKVEENALSTINPADVAVIKVLRPGNNLVGGPGGAIALYTKAGVYSSDPSRRYTFNVRGYDPARTIWK